MPEWPKLQSICAVSNELKPQHKYPLPKISHSGCLRSQHYISKNFKMQLLAAFLITQTSRQFNQRINPFWARRALSYQTMNLSDKNEPPNEIALQFNHRMKWPYRDTKTWNGSHFTTKTSTSSILVDACSGCINPPHLGRERAPAPEPERYFCRRATGRTAADLYCFC